MNTFTNLIIELIFNFVMIAYLLGQTKQKEHRSLSLPSIADVLRESIVEDPNELLKENDNEATFDISLVDETKKSKIKKQDRAST